MKLNITFDLLHELIRNYAMDLIGIAVELELEAMLGSHPECCLVNEYPCPSSVMVICYNEPYKLLFGDIKITVPKVRNHSVNEICLKLIAYHLI